MSNTRDTLTPEALAEIERRAEEASKGRWLLWRRERKGLELVWVEDERGRHVSGMIHHPDAEDSANATFIAAARTDIPALCASLRAAWAERDALKAEVEANRIDQAEAQGEAEEEAHAFARCRAALYRSRKIADALEAERDALRAEVERLRSEAALCHEHRHGSRCGMKAGHPGRHRNAVDEW